MGKFVSETEERWVTETGTKNLSGIQGAVVKTSNGRVFSPIWGGKWDTSLIKIAQNKHESSRRCWEGGSRKGIRETSLRGTK